MKYFFSVCVLLIALFSCTKSTDAPKVLGPATFTVTADTSIKYFVQNTDIPILLDSMTLNLYAVVDEKTNNYYVEKVPIAKGTPLEQFVKSKITYNPQNVTYNNTNLNIIHNWSTRFQTINFTTNTYTTTIAIPSSSYKSNVVVAGGIFVSLDVFGNIGNPVLAPSQNLDKFFIAKKNLGTGYSDRYIRLFAIKKNSLISSLPSLKNYDGRLIPFSESNNYYYIYFYPMSTNSYDATIYKDLLFSNNADLIAQLGGFVANNFIASGFERVYIVEYIKDNNGRTTINPGSLIRSNELY